MENKNIFVSNLDNETKEFIIRKIPAIAMKTFVDKYADNNSLSNNDLVSLLNHSGIDINQIDDHVQLSQIENEILEFNTDFFSTRKRIRIPTFKNNKFTPQPYPNSDPFIGAIISSSMATYLQLKNELSLEEAFDLWEIGTINKINEIKSLEG